MCLMCFQIEQPDLFSDQKQKVVIVCLYLLLLFWQGINSTCHMSHVTTPLDHQPLPSP